MLNGYETKEPQNSVEDYINSLKNGFGRTFMTVREIEQ